MKSETDKVVHIVAFGEGMTTLCLQKIQTNKNDGSYDKPFTMIADYATCEECLQTYGKNKNKKK